MIKLIFATNRVAPCWPLENNRKNASLRHFCIGFTSHRFLPGSNTKALGCAQALPPTLHLFCPILGATRKTIVKCKLTRRTPSCFMFVFVSLMNCGLLNCKQKAQSGGVQHLISNTAGLYFLLLAHHLK